jgi:hypothetical protein
MSSTSDIYAALQGFADLVQPFIVIAAFLSLVVTVYRYYKND